MYEGGGEVCMRGGGGVYEGEVSHQVGGRRGEVCMREGGGVYEGGRGQPSGWGEEGGRGRERSAIRLGGGGGRCV